MLSSSRVIHQNLVHADIEGLEIILIKISDLNKDITQLRTVVERNEGRALGLSGAYSPFGGLRLLAVADATTVVVIDFESDNGKNNEPGTPPEDPSTAGHDYLRDRVLRRSAGFLYAFDMGPLALALWQSRDLRIQQAIDVQSAFTNRDPFRMIQFAINDAAAIVEVNIRRIFEDNVYHAPDDPAGHKTTTPLALRAWISHHISQIVLMEGRFAKVPPVNTFKLSDTVLRFLSKSSKDAFQLHEQKPTEVTQTVATSFDKRKKEVNAKVDRYQNKIRQRNNQQVRIHVPASEAVGGYTISANVNKARGQGVILKTEGSLASKQVASVTVTGRDALTAVEVKRAQVILLILQGKITAEGKDFNPWIQKVFLDPGDDFTWPAGWVDTANPPIKFKPKKIPRPLNPSQVEAIKAMLSQSDDSRITIIQGPPGTGKTTVIASYVLTALGAGKTGIWLIAQSNIAVKNIAEKLADFGLVNWKLLVSSEFYEFWHEHLYASIRSNIIVSEDFIAKCPQLHGCPVVLCTLSMLSSPTLQYQGVFRMVPLQTIIVDEASQIEVGGYIPLFTNATTIRKVTFIGDDKQLPPYGQEEIRELQSIFEVEHLSKHRIMLSTQYRMPPQIGDFISHSVYSGLLESNLKHPLAVTQEMTCHFVDVPAQQISQGTSWKNPEECKAILQLASIFETQKKKFKIITPYDGQRTLIENELRKAELPWEDKCFNVDSFQGNEEDYIVISLVRSMELGFLRDLRRTNVMLTRCKRGMVIFTSKTFMQKYGKDSLVGNLLDYYENEAWIGVQEMEKTLFV